jgi:hypothetical protein
MRLCQQAIRSQGLKVFPHSPDAHVYGKKSYERYSSPPPPSREKKKMSSLGSLLKLLFTHPGEFGTLVQFKLFHKVKRDLSAIHEHPASGWDRQTMRRCWEFLDLTSRSFAAVIKELDGDLARIVRCFLSLVKGIDGPTRPSAPPPRSRSGNEMLTSF